ncbi:hypothetical protein CXG81DRAFT_23799 [Caulochytrium protostelioides]|uniref:Uncharacterized protein n=1 Tax=Caulochytrium protostelioides TaxID=1555241 RepID=A0A4P9XDJ2_9FUNG|nr:hypothetical protein CXG81DRAFT_23799 [Caulochytrium protostelioides]|eukprot:RKP03538.1 hypothetical protein CXG81DRAFT_23799 [Caulochytrium protostelioides]
MPKRLRLKGDDGPSAKRPRPKVATAPPSTAVPSDARQLPSTPSSARPGGRTDGDAVDADAAEGASPWRIATRLRDLNGPITISSLAGPASAVPLHLTAPAPQPHHAAGDMPPSVGFFPSPEPSRSMAPTTAAAALNAWTPSSVDYVWTIRRLDLRPATSLLAKADGHGGGDDDGGGGASTPARANAAIAPTFVLQSAHATYLATGRVDRRADGTATWRVDATARAVTGDVATWICTYAPDRGAWHLQSAGGTGAYLGLSEDACAGPGSVHGVHACADRPTPGVREAFVIRCQRAGHGAAARAAADTAATIADVPTLEQAAV